MVPGTPPLYQGKPAVILTNMVLLEVIRLQNDHFPKSHLSILLHVYPGTGGEGGTRHHLEAYMGMPCKHDFVLWLQGKCKNWHLDLNYSFIKNT